MKNIIAIDADEIIAAFFDSFVEFHNKYYRSNVQKTDVISFRLEDIFKASIEEMETRIDHFENSVHITQIQPVEGSSEGIEKLLNRGYELHVVTARPTRLENETKRWIKKHFPTHFKRIHFSINPYTKSEASHKKAEICKHIGAKVLIDDNIDNALDCAKNGIKVLLMDAPWNQRPKLPKNIVRVKGWKDILKVLK